MVEKEFSTLYKKRGYFNSNIWDKWKCICLCFYFLVCYFQSMHLRAVFLWGSEKTNRKYLLELMKWRSKVHQKNMSREKASDLDQWTLFSENYKPISVWLWFASKITETNCLSRTFAEFIQNQKRYPVSFDKVSVPT